MLRYAYRLIDATPGWLQPFLPALVLVICVSTALLMVVCFRWSGDASGWYTLGSVFGFIMGIFATLGYLIAEEEAERERQQQAQASTEDLRYPGGELRDVTPYSERLRD